LDAGFTECSSNGSDVLFNWALCCYFRKQGLDPTTYCQQNGGTNSCQFDCLSVSDSILDNFCNNLNIDDIINYLRRKKCGGQLTDDDLCCRVAIQQQCPSPCINNIEHTITEVVPPDTCSPIGTPPLPVINDLAILYGTCFQDKCNFSLSSDPCGSSCQAIEDHCRRLECARLNPPDGVPCPGSLILVGNCGCPDNGFPYQGCPGSEIGAAPSPFTTNPEIKLVSVKINNQEVCLPVLCEGNCDGYTFCE
jgi:hypothetical protein